MHSQPFRIPDDIPTSLHPLIEQFCSDAFRIRGVTQQTVRADICYLCRLFRHFGCPDSSSKLIQAVSSESIGNFLRDYTGTFSSSSLERMQILLRSFLRFAYRFSLIDRDLSALVPTRKHRQMGTVPRSLPDGCIAQLQCGIDRSTAAGMRDSAIVCLLATYGVRGVQIRRLRLDDIDWRRDRIHFPAAKGGRAIEQHLVAEAGDRLSEYVRCDRPESGHPEVFLTLHEPFGPLPSATYLSNTIKGHIKRLGLALPDGMSHGTHGFRHAFASRMVGKVPFKELVDQLGHRDPASTLIYSKVDLDGLHLRSFHEGTGNSAPLFVSAPNKRLGYQQAKRAFRKLCNQCGLHGEPPARLHDLRHNYASECLARWQHDGEDIQILLPVLSTAMGHINPCATQRYIHINAATLLDASGKIHDRFIQPSEENQ